MSTMPVPGKTSRADPHATEKNLTRVYVWDRVVRSTHWIIALTLFALSATGIYIGNPFITVPGEAGEHFVMGWTKTIHFYLAIVFTLAVLSRILWMFVGPYWARWHQFIPTTKKRLQDFWTTILFYTFIKRDAPPAVGHNPVAGAAYVAVFGLYMVIILTGLGLYGMSAHVDSPMRWFDFLNTWFGGAQMARWFHHAAMWLLLGFFVHHVYSSLLMSVTERNGTLESIFSGYKWFKGDPEKEKE